MPSHTPFDNNAQWLQLNIAPAETQKSCVFSRPLYYGLAMHEKNTTDTSDSLDAVHDRLRILEEKFLYQEQTLDALNDVIIEQETQLNSLRDQYLRIQAMLSAGEENFNNGEDPPPPHY